MHLPWRRRLVFHLTTLAVVPAIVGPLIIVALGIAGSVPPAEVAKRMLFAAAGLYLTVLAMVVTVELVRGMVRSANRGRLR